MSFTDGKTTMIGTQEGTVYLEIEWDPTDVTVDWMPGRDQPKIREEFGDNTIYEGTYIDDRDTWLNGFEVMLSNGDYLGGGADQYDKKDYHRKCNKQKPSDPRHSIGRMLLRFYGALGAGGIEGITAYFLKSDAEGTEIHDVVSSPSMEELKARTGEEVVRFESTY